MDQNNTNEGNSIMDFQKTLEALNSMNTTRCHEAWMWTGRYRLLLTLISTVIILVGTTGNTIAYFVLKQKAYKNNIMASALRILSIMDNIILWTIVSRRLIKGLTRFDFSLSAPKFCLFFQFYILVMTSNVNWHLVIITLTRLIHLKCPFKTQAICSKLNYYLLLTVSHVVVISIHGSVLITIWNREHIEKQTNYRVCYAFSSREESKQIIHQVVNVTCNLIAPAVLLITFNFLIGKELGKMEARERLLKARPKAFGETSSMQNKETTDYEKEDATANALDWEYGLGRLNTSGNIEGSGGDAVFSSEQSEDTTDELCQQQNEGLSRTRNWLLLEEIELSDKKRLSEKRFKCSRVDKSWVIQNYLRAIEPSVNVSQNAQKAQPHTAASEIWSSERTIVMADAPKVSESKAPSINKMTSWITSIPTFDIEDLSKPSRFASDLKVKPSSSSIKSMKEKWSGRLNWDKFHRVSHILNQPIVLDNESLPSSCENQSQKDANGGNAAQHQSYSDVRVTPEERHSAYAPKASYNAKKDSRVQSLTRLLMIASAVFLILNVPYWSYHLFFRPYAQGHLPNCEKEKAEEKKWKIERKSGGYDDDDDDDDYSDGGGDGVEDNDDDDDLNLRVFLQAQFHFKVGARTVLGCVSNPRPLGHGAKPLPTELSRPPDDDDDDDDDEEEEEEEWCMH
ncbi:Mu-type opioid receptor-like [Elysia marginata]|uniref:Mu-type opioid receptor-like n=1 Tax=Elysia marginata TaxID=1093978 RepID=A0AAV4FUW9_9GAST|nr:Mu-type opioid receptor-like [Elysia marginata]